MKCFIRQNLFILTINLRHLQGVKFMYDCVTGTRVDNNFGCIMADEMVSFYKYLIEFSLKFRYHHILHRFQNVLASRERSLIRIRTTSNLCFNGASIL